MPAHVLVAFDGAPQSESALLYAFDAFPDASITVITVADVLGDPTIDDDPLAVQRDELEARCESVLAEAESLAADRGREIETAVRLGVPHRDIVEHAAESDVDHVVLGGHGRTSVDHPFLGSVSEAVVRRAPVATTLVPLDPESYRELDLDGSVLVPVDGSPAATGALEYAVSTFPSADPTALHVVGLPFEYSASELEDSPFKRILAGLTERGEAVLESTVDEAAVGNATVETALTYGKPPQSIVDYALDYAFDQVVMGIHGRPSRRRILTGSVAETVARRAEFPVTFVRRPSDRND
ncbi:universal stress protein [Halovivax sp.]|uniref:universal stress protein n=1 Tax=Halovivax sp. TaxID=1935978 RepID=UPI0025C4DA1E|nr:universal stress protein [Halovivax sp.]